jgi:hypothetical protein
MKAINKIEKRVNEDSKTASLHNIEQYNSKEE